MKIENPPLFLNNNTSEQSSRQDLGFDALVNTTRQDDDYYWYHQNQLQQSDITFAIKSRNLTTSPLSNIEYSELSIMKPDHQLPPERPTMDVIINKMHSECPTQKQNLSLPNNSNLNRIASSNQTLLAESLTQLLLNEKNTQALLQTTHLSKIPPLALASTFKQYQLFVDGNQVELTFNTAGLSKQHINDIKTFICDWLKQKGFTLKQLVLNGEQQ